MASGPPISVDIRDFRFPHSPEPLFSALTFDVAPGEVVAILGPSGTGKTTLLRMICGLENGFQGAITVGGQPARHAPAPGFVFQDARLLPWANLAGNLRIVRPNANMLEIEAALEQVGLPDAALAKPHQLSGGMKRRAGLARALLARPAVLLLDEPFAALDTGAAHVLRQLLQNVLKQTRPTTLLVSHEAEDAVHLADRVLIIQGRPARIIADIGLGTPDPNSGQAAIEIRRSILAAAIAGQPKPDA